jgi:glycosyltransferase involved in cell wall biosynthesis
LVDKKINIVVIDDNSNDGTGDIVENIKKENKRVDIINRPGKLGIGSAHMEGFQYGLKKGFDYILSMDADFSHNPYLYTLSYKKDGLMRCLFWFSIYKRRRNKELGFNQENNKLVC